jgi:Zinc finger, C2H2 type
LSFKCNICQRKFPSSETLKRHHSVKHTQNNKKFNCDLCGFSLANINAMRQHIQLHMLRQTCSKDSKGNYGCHICDMKSTALRHIARHIVNVHESDQDQFECDKCEKKFGNPGYLALHMKSHAKSNKRTLRSHSKVNESKNKKKVQNKRKKQVKKQKKEKSKSKPQKKVKNQQTELTKAVPMEEEDLCDEIVPPSSPPNIGESMTSDEEIIPKAVELIEFLNFKQEIDSTDLAQIQEKEPENEQTQMNKTENKDQKQDDDGFESDWLNDYENENDDSDWSDKKNENVEEKKSSVEQKIDKVRILI